MPKNFQTSQYDEPIAFNGFLDVELDDGTVYRVEIERAHMEEDTGKSLHVGGSTGRIHGATHSLVDYNRAGIPLIEIVTKPMTGAGERAPEIARAYVATLRDLLKALDVSDVRMEQGSMRCDVNLSLMPQGRRRSSAPARRPRTSTRCARSSGRCATRSAATRRSSTSGGTVVQETRHWHEDTGVTTSGRVKSDADDYRYFPEPDLVPVAPSRETVEALRGTLPEPPAARRKRLQADWGFADLEMRDVVNAGLVELVEETVAAGASPAAARKWWSGEVARRANAEGQDVPTYAAGLGVGPASVVELEGARDLAGGSTTRWPDRSGRACSRVRAPRPRSPTPAGSSSSQDTGALEAAVDAVIAANPDVADKIRDGKVQAVGALIGQVMREMKGQADAAAARALILERLGQS